jgi:hypothetical protein
MEQIIQTQVAAHNRATHGIVSSSFLQLAQAGEILTRHLLLRALVRICSSAANLIKVGIQLGLFQPHKIFQSHSVTSVIAIAKTMQIKSKEFKVSDLTLNFQHSFLSSGPVQAQSNLINN